jgi:hypothetical protein
MTNPLFTAPRLLAYLLANMASDFENILSSTKLTPELYTGKDSRHTTDAGTFSLLNSIRLVHSGLDWIIGPKSFPSRLFLERLFQILKLAHRVCRSFP